MKLVIKQDTTTSVHFEDVADTITVMKPALIAIVSSFSQMDT